MSQLITNGTYNIFSVRPAATLYLTFTSDASGTNLTTWQENNAADQQWIIEGTDNRYQVQNVMYKNYISWTQDVAFVYADTNPFLWYVRNINGIFSPTDSMNSGWNVDDGYNDNNNPVIIYGDDPTTGIGSPWSLATISLPSSSSSASSTLTSTSTSTASTSPPSNTSSGGLAESDKITLGTAIGFGVPSIIIGIIGIKMWPNFKGWWKKKRPETYQLL
ncbi:hypothetical protein BT96DRAFT_991290 [Gymnopus androsaceus JB14]|uniref:Ricin B lectin domain-containing protein n=1 Tax=Gymnopus androsaceus JB14 TaxID=1447944 RepID=A0A6A4HVT6_9AGAR|nr:hypothetical protein BT96DRAFT_991290 [Gymnopus androsaceus JB14]